MIGINELRAGVRVFARHLRNAARDPRRLGWVFARTFRILLSGKTSAVLQRHVIVADLYADYPDWVRRFATLGDAARAALRATVDQMASKPLISIVMPTFNPDPGQLDEAIGSLEHQVYPHWELCIADDASTRPEVREILQRRAAADSRIRLTLRPANGGISTCSNTALGTATGVFVAFLDQDDVLTEDALVHVAQAIVANPQAVVVYSDEDKLDTSGALHSPHFKPDWNPEWARTTNYVLHLMAIKREALVAAGGFDSSLDGVQDWDLLLRVTENLPDAAIVHVPRVLYHWRESPGSTATGVNQKPGIVDAQRRVIEASLQRQRIAATIEQTLGGWWIRYTVPDPAPLVSIVIPTHDHGELLANCIESIERKTQYPNYELVIVDHRSTEPLARKVIDGVARNERHIVVAYEGEFNYPAECNLGVDRARGEIVVLLNNDIEIISPWWLDELVGHAIQPLAGIVGALLLYPDDTIQHAGVIVGVNGAADRPYIGYARGYGGIAGRALAAQNVTAMITACAAVTRARYQAVGGMDETLAISHNDIDLCLRLAERGWRNVWTPHAELYHHESASRGYDNNPEQQRLADDEKRRFEARWGAKAAFDPFYNVNLASDGTLFALASPPRSLHQRVDVALD